LSGNRAFGRRPPAHAGVLFEFLENRVKCAARTSSGKHKIAAYGFEHDAVGAESFPVLPRQQPLRASTRTDQNLRRGRRDFAFVFDRQVGARHFLQKFLQLLRSGFLGGNRVARQHDDVRTFAVLCQRSADESFIDSNPVSAKRKLLQAISRREYSRAVAALFLAA
jgi:hypothetical protein